ncbi:NAD(P)H-dependent oxidoreductase [Roseibium aggregatum]|uniref:NAD(P)H-dependent oxidoreductase n=1 Tax=Roseibium aggregatum TaxID=187304 RepID=A0A939EEJ9_9HYPH|nr:NAD(P)H-dependent oxidoreductase [Roseibium aggregatum]MBN9671092.1 NAD(P)H-dependent oxidoreductase [Roseibium aggregatum]
MRVLVVFCHPCKESFNAAICKTVTATLEENGHEVRLSDLYASGFDPVMSAEERRGYHAVEDNTIPVADHLADIMWCEGIVFVYPTWWFGPPAMLKGWLERVWLPHETFEMPTAGRGMQPKMQHITRIGVVTTCGASWLVSKLVGEPGRKIILRGIRLLAHPRCKTMYMAHFKMDSSTPESRENYLATVKRRLGSFFR